MAEMMPRDEMVVEPKWPLRRPRVGHIQFLNCLPLYYGLVRNRTLLDIELVKGTPTDLNRMLLEGSLDVSPISSIEFLRHHDELVLLPDLTVSSDGAVKSITLVSKVPLCELNGHNVALSNASATSHVLTRIILETRYGVRPTYSVRPPDLKRMLEEATAALLIGDAALRAQRDHQADLLVYDLGQEWRQHAGQTMVYAVWAVRREFATRAPELVAEIHVAFQRSLRCSLERVEEIAKAAARWEPFSALDLAAYFRSLRFEFGPRYQAGLIEFARQARRLGELQDVPALEFAQIAGRVEQMER